MEPHLNLYSSGPYPFWLSRWTDIIGDNGVTFEPLLVWNPTHVDPVLEQISLRTLEPHLDIYWSGSSPMLVQYLNKNHWGHWSNIWAFTGLRPHSCWSSRWTDITGDNGVNLEPPLLWDCSNYPVQWKLAEAQPSVYHMAACSFSSLNRKHLVLFNNMATWKYQNCKHIPV